MAMTALAPADPYRRRPGVPRPHWPATLPDATRFRVRYNPVADEVVVRFAHPLGPVVSDPIDAPDVDASLLVEEGTGAVVGAHVLSLLLGAVPASPAWRRLAEPGPPPTAVAAFLADIIALAARYGADGSVEGLPPA